MVTNHTESVKNLTIEDLLLHVQDKYSKTTVNNKWYIGTTGENQQSVFACINCGNPSHYENDCINDFVEGPHNRRDHSSFKGNRGRFGQERGRGRFGRGRGREINIFRVPPVQKTSYSRSRNQDLEHQCGTCGVWGQHKTNEHGTTSAMTCQPIVPSTDDPVIVLTKSMTFENMSSTPTEQPAFGVLMRDLC